jgi:minor extracellular serine protease Vpr
MNIKKLFQTMQGTALLLCGLAMAAAANAGTWIVQLDDPPAAQFMAQQRQAGADVSEQQIQDYRQALTAGQNDFLAALDSEGIGYSLETTAIPDYEGNLTEVPLRYTMVLNGLALSLDDSAVQKVRAMPEVASVERNWYLFPSLDNSVEYIRAPRVYGDVAELTRFDDHREGFEGQGINVAVIDTGIDWTHEMFGGDPTPPRFGLAPQTAAVDTHEKVIYYLPTVDAVEDLNGHGTHVSSTAAGYLGFAPGDDGVPLTEDDEAVHGVAPQARLMGYSVCSNIGSTAGVFGCPSINILLALEDAVSPRTLTGFSKPVAHVINLSLGGAGGPDSATAVGASNAALAGAIVAAAAGNSGPGEGTVGSPSAGRHVISVAASNDSGVFPSSVDVLEALGGPVEPGTPKLVADFAGDSNAGMGPVSVSEHYVFAGLADTPDQVPLEVAGRICLTVRGSTLDAGAAGTGLFANKAANCEAKGAIAMLMYNNEPGRPGPLLAPSGIPVYSISLEDGEFLQDLGYDAAGISNHPIRINLPDAALHEPAITGFSSRGPVQGLGQVKPEISAPGHLILAAASAFAPPTVAVGSPTGYAAISGTSMATPHMAGAAAQVKQAHLDWSPAMVRTALINTATNPRELNGEPEPDGPATDNILSQGGGLADVEQAVNAEALMGVTGDGVNAPEILGSHSFGAVPVVNSRVSHTESVTVTLKDLSGEGGNYDLSVANNRALELDGVDVSVSPDSTAVDPDGTATFTVNVTVDGDRVREPGAQLQWFVYAHDAESGEQLRMPFYLLPTETVPAGSAATETKLFQDTILVGDQNLGLVEGVTFNNHEVEAAAGALRLSADLDFPPIVDGSVPDLDLFVTGPDGEEVASSTNPGGPESVSFRVDDFGTYTFRVNGWLNVATDYTLTVVKDIGGEPPVASAIEGEYTNADGESVDFDGSYTVEWTAPDGDVQRYEVERSVNGGAFEPIAEVDAGTTSYSETDQANGTYAYRIRALYPGEIGFYVSAASNEMAVVVDQRQQVDITADTRSTISNVSFTGGVFEFDLQLTNESSQRFVPLVEFNIVSIDSASGTVEVINADNGGSGTSNDDPALFDYSGELGDEVFDAGETTGARHLEFRDEASELFTFQAVVTAYQRTGGGTSGTGSSTDDGDTEDGSGSSGLESLTRVLEFTVDPLTATVTISLIEVL